MGGILRQADGRLETARARIVIGADGRQSTVARGARPPFRRNALRQPRRIPNEGCRWIHRSGLSAGGLHGVFVGLPSEAYRAHRRRPDPRPRRADWAQRPRARRTPQAPGARRPAAPLRHLRQARGHGCARRGDAGCLKDPCTAHGITDAFRDSESRAGAITGGLEGGLAGQEPQRHALSHELSHELFEVTDRIASDKWDLATLRSLHRRPKGAMKDELAQIRALPPRTAAA